MGSTRQGFVGRRPLAVWLIVAGVLAAGCGGSTTTTTKGGASTHAAATTAKHASDPVAPSGNGIPSTSIKQLTDQLRVLITYAPVDNSYRIVAYNGSAVALKEPAFEFWGGPATQSSGFDGGVKPLTEDTGGLKISTQYEGLGRPRHGPIRQGVTIPDFGPGRRVTISVSYPKGGTCVAGQIDFFYKDKIVEDGSEAFCNPESGLNSADYDSFASAIDRG